VNGPIGRVREITDRVRAQAWVAVPEGQGTAATGTCRRCRKSPRWGAECRHARRHRLIRPARPGRGARADHPEGCG
jgi:hypothetical protein